MSRAKKDRPRTEAERAIIQKMIKTHVGFVMPQVQRNKYQGALANQTKGLASLNSNEKTNERISQKTQERL